MKLTLALDSQQIFSYLNCPMQFNYSYRESVSKTGLKKTAMDRGTVIHELCAIYGNIRALDHKSNFGHAAEAAVDVIKKTALLDELNLRDEYNFLATRFVQFICYNNLKHCDLTPVVKNKKPAIELGFSEIIYEDSEYLFLLEGRIDLISKIGASIVWVDYKTQERINNLYKYKVQFLCYGLATNLPGMVQYIGLQKEINDKSFRRDLISFPPALLAEWRETLINKVYKPLARTLKNHNPVFEMRRESCSGAYDSSPCQFTDLCETFDERIREGIKTQNYVNVEPWRPWK